jgi:hypothetical protein
MGRCAEVPTSGSFGPSASSASRTWEDWPMTVGWSREEAVAATRTQLLRAGAVTDGYAGIELA